MWVSKSLFRRAMLPVWIAMGALPRIAAAAPYWGEVMPMEQPDGSLVDTRVYGDEFYVRVEGLDGYTLVRDPQSGYICYAGLNADSSAWVSTGVPYQSGPGKPAPSFSGPSMRPGMDLKPAARRSIREAAAKSLGLGAAGNTADTDAGMADPVGAGGGPDAQGMLLRKAAADSVKRVLGVIVLVEFPDARATLTKQQISDMANLKGYNVNGNNGSIRDYFLDVSHGKFEYSMVVTDYYMARNNKAYYDRPGGYAGGQELIKEALQGLEAKGFDFSTLSTSSSGTVKGVNVLFAGAAGKTWGQGIWAHRGNIAALNFDGVKVSGYMLTPIGTAPTIGTFIHESGHLLFGWPDLYDYDSDSRGAGSFCLMSGQFSKNPQPPNAWFRVGQGWEPIVDLRTVANGLITLPSNGRANFKYGNPANPKEGYVLENIAKKGRWANLPDAGLMIWHVDDAGNNSWQDMTPARHYRVAVEQADNKFDLERNVNGGGANDLFRSGNNAAFSAASSPNSNWWSGAGSGLDIAEISAARDTMTFRLKGMPAVGVGREAAPASGAAIRRMGRHLRVTVPAGERWEISAATPDGRAYPVALRSNGSGGWEGDLSALPSGICVITAKENGSKRWTRSLVLE